METSFWMQLFWAWTIFMISSGGIDWINSSWALDK